MALLSILLDLGVLLEKDDYREIVKPALEWRFERVYARRGMGNGGVRRALVAAAFVSRAVAHSVPQEEFESFLKKTSLDGKPDWCLHSMRELLNTLLANPSCASHTTELVKALKEVNKIQRSR